jgi:hypothetical protein
MGIVAVCSLITSTAHKVNLHILHSERHLCLGSPVSVGTPNSSAPSLQDLVRGMPMPPRHPAAGASGCQRAGTVSIPVSLTPVGALTTTRPRQQPASRSGQPSPDDSLEAREREDSVGLLSPSPPSSSPRVSFLGSRSRNGSAASLARISGAFTPARALEQAAARTRGTTRTSRCRASPLCSADTACVRTVPYRASRL